LILNIFHDDKNIELKNSEERTKEWTPEEQEQEQEQELE